MKYLVGPVKTNEEFIWEVYEVSSEQVVGRFYFEEDAVAQAEFMEDGGAFDGFTPQFMLREVALVKDVNQEFSAVFG